MIDELTKNIQQWAVARNLHDADPHKQILKLGEEFGELCQALSKNRKPSAIKDAIGDMYVVLTILALQLDLDIEDCVAVAYNEIQDRKGKMINGVFVKEADFE
jgi:NTP pyrophosphatase (non-canonical NTP hydrolase)